MVAAPCAVPGGVRKGFCFAGGLCALCPRVERGQNVATKSCGAIAEKERVKIRTFGGAANCVCLQTCLFEIEEPCTVHHPEN